MNIVDLVPGTSIGRLSLGSPADLIPKEAIITGALGELDGLKFSLADGKISDVWVEDLRKFAGEVRSKGKPLPRDIPLETLKAMFGTCEQVDVKGGVFFNCLSGVTIGTDAEASGIFIQLRLRPR